MTSYYGPLYTPTYGSGDPGPGTLVNAWSIAFGRPLAATPAPPALPLALELDAATSVGGGSGTPTTGNWLFAIVAWRQDAGTAGVLQYPSTNTICDDVHNFWIPVSVTAPQTGIVRTAVWMAPAFRAPRFVFASPTAYQSAVTLIVLEVTAAVPWYEVAAFATAYTNQGTSVTRSQDPASGLFSVGVIAYDLNTLTVTFTDSGWTQQGQAVASNGSDDTGDLTMTAFTATTTGSSMTLAASGTGGDADWAETLIVVHGVTDAIEFPYQDSLDLPNWPVLIFEMACGQVLNQNWTFDGGISPWTATSFATAAASDVFTFGNSAGSLAVHPAGSVTNPGALSEKVPAVPFTAYAATAQVTIPAGWTGVSIGILWYDSGGSEISGTSATFTVTGSLQELTLPDAVAPAGTATAQLVVAFSGVTDPPSTTLMYISYAALGLPGALGATPPDQLSWTDLSDRTITIEPVRFSRGIQYEQQSLEAGTLELPLANNDGALTAGNAASPYYPWAGQTDVPVRLRAIWPSSPAPYAPLFTGFADDVKVRRDKTTLYGYISLTASDCWSRLTAQMLTAGQQETLEDDPAAFYPCNDAAGAVAAANLAPTTLPPLAQQDSKFGTSNLNIGFGFTNISLPGDPGGTGWGLDNLIITGDILLGASLVLFPPDPSVLPPIASGVTCEAWVFFSPRAASVDWNGVIASCVSAKSPVWQLEVGAPTGAFDGQVFFIVFDKISGAPTTTFVDTGTNWGLTRFYSVTFTQTAWQVYKDGFLAASGACNFADVYNGFSFNGQNVPYAGLAGNCFNGVMQDIAIFPGVLPQNRILTHYNIPLNAALDEIDVSRVARVTGYGGFAPPLAMLGLGLPPAFTGDIDLPASNPDVDPVTQITDTLGQIVSDYWTNIASSTLAALFVDGTGALVYRRRYEWYDRVQGQQAIGEHAPAALNANPRFAYGVQSWTATGATLAWAAGKGQFNGSGAAELTATGAAEVGLAPEDQAATPGQSYSCLIIARCPAGYAGGGFAQLTFLDSSLSETGFTTGNTVPLVAGAWTWLWVSAQAPAGTAYVTGIFGTSGTPSNSTVFYVGSVTTAIYPGEAPYLRNENLSDDRAQMFNSAVLTQTGTGTLTTYSGTSLDFTPTSGITVTAQNSGSVAQRGNVPYTATVYLQNTMQALPFGPNQGSIEDLASWIVNTLGTPVLRAESVTLTPGATWQDMAAALFGEIGDTVTMALRPLGAPPLSLVTYLSNLEHEIDVRTGWTTTWQLSPAPQATILQCDNPELGVLDGNNLIGF